MPDLLAMQKCNLLCLPENYQLKVRVQSLRQHLCRQRPSVTDICEPELLRNCNFTLMHVRSMPRNGLQRLKLCSCAVLLLSHLVVASAALRR